MMMSEGTVAVVQSVPFWYYQKEGLSLGKDLDVALEVLREFAVDTKR